MFFWKRRNTISNAFTRNAKQLARLYDMVQKSDREMQSYVTPERIQVYHDKESQRLEIVREGTLTEKGTYHEWIEGLPGDCGVIRSQETGRVVGIRMKVSRAAVCEVITTDGTQ